MALMIDSTRGQNVARLLYDTFTTVGILGRNDMPEDEMPKEVARGSLEHIMFMTLTVSIDYLRDAPALWNSSRMTFEDPQTRYLFYPELLHETPPKKVIEDMKRYALSKKPVNDAHIWRTIGVTFYKKWNGDPRHFLDDCGWESLHILHRLKTDKHEYGKRWVTDYPFLRGPKIGPLWLRMLRDNVGISSLKNLENVPIPVDRHIARATLTTGVVRGRVNGKLEELFKDVRKVWFKSVRGLNVANRAMIALDVDEPLWHLSKYGCATRDTITGHCSVFQKCEARQYCVSGRVSIKNDIVELDT